MTARTLMRRLDKVAATKKGDSAWSVRVPASVDLDDREALDAVIERHRRLTGYEEPAIVAVEELSVEEWLTLSEQRTA